MARLEATTFNETQLGEIIRSMQARYRTPATKDTESGESTGSGTKLHDLIVQREQHYYNRPEADPRLPEPHNRGPKFQSDILRQTHNKLKARLVENAPIVKVTPGGSTSDQQGAAQRAEAVLQRGLELVQERQGIHIQSQLADGQSILCYGVLHWQKSLDVWPQLTEAEPTEKATDRLKRRRREQAAAGFPWMVEVIHPGQVYPLPDRSFANGLGGMLVMRQISLLKYKTDLEQGKLYLSLNEQDKNILIYEEEQRPASWQPSVGIPGDWGKEVVIAQWWTRDEFYELARLSDAAKWTLIKSFKHPYEMPPFTLVPANVTNNPDPALSHEPAMAGLYRLKPYADFDMTLAKALAAQIALPLYYISDAEGNMMMDDENVPIILTRDALSARALPKGAKIEKLDFQMNPAFIQFVEVTRTDMNEARPPTGEVEITASTQPWTARLGQQQANVEPARLVREQAAALRTMLRNWLLVMGKPASEGGFGVPVPVFGLYDENGRLDRENTIQVEPDEIQTLEVDVIISATSAAERITATEHGRTLLDDPLVPVGPYKYAEDFMQEPDPQAVLDQYEGEMVYQEFYRPQVVRQQLARDFEEFIVLSANGGFVGLDGSELTPEQVIRGAGGSVQQRPAADPLARSVGTMVTQPGSGPLNPPGAVPLPGMTAG